MNHYEAITLVWLLAGASIIFVLGFLMYAVLLISIARGYIKRGWPIYEALKKAKEVLR